MQAHALVLMTGICLCTMVVSARADDDRQREPKPKITVTGTGKLSVIPDLAEIQVGVRTQASSAASALAANTEAMTALHGILKERGVAAKDIRTTQIQVTPIYSQPPNPGRGGEGRGEFIPRVVSYRVDNMVEITSRNVDKLGELLDALVQGGANQIHGISFRVDRPEKLLDDARKRAMADARRKAEILAGEAGVVVGPPLQIDEESAAAPPPRFMGFARSAMPMAAAPVPVAAGEQELAVTVRVVYELKAAK